MFSTVFSWLVVAAYALMVGATTVQVILKRRPVGVTLSWLLLIYAIPLLGVVCYQAFGERYLGRFRARRARNMERKYKLNINRSRQSAFTTETAQSPTAEPLNRLTQGLLGLPITTGNKLENYDDSLQALQRLKQDIDDAESRILLEFYIVETGGLVDQCLQALCDAVQRGVAVILLVDSVGSRNFLRSPWSEQLRQHGVKLVEALHANPLRMLLQRIDLRLHRKIVAIDYRIAYVGSMNLVDPRFFNRDPQLGQWVDLMIRIKGPAAANLDAIVAYDYEMETGISVLEDFSKLNSIAPAGNQTVQLLPSGPGIFGEHILRLLLTSIYVARSQIILTTPYFVPDESLHTALVSAALRGVDVQLILPKRNDSRLVRYASHSFYQELLEAGVKIYQFNDGLLHTKSLLIDNSVALVGTVNLDMRSFTLNFEVTSIIDDQEYCADLCRIIQSYRARSELVELLRWRKRPLHRRITENFVHLISPLL
ncbi:cardiolipin synthase [Aliagarivorans taiwanensis]|uniref:cardiolipin synthase n=1 Tax=Aliagarivorans taiwanensis TaxID=561966 RepID=UPI00041C258A|nr:cardiolipin synthase [Aliagarivorans taiwanensis]